VVRTTTSDGTEIWNYVNGREAVSCSGGGMAYRGMLTAASYNSFTNCVQQHAVCNNMFYVKDGVVLKYVPVGSGGARCYTNDQSRPDFSGPANFR
jgi:hypothetical protein